MHGGEKIIRGVGGEGAKGTGGERATSVRELVLGRIKSVVKLRF